jgi:hypothetical protein
LLDLEDAHWAAGWLPAMMGQVAPQLSADTTLRVLAQPKQTTSISASFCGHPFRGFGLIKRLFFVNV